MAASNILWAIGAGGIIAIFGFFITSGKGSDILKGLTNLFQKKQQEKIDAIEEHQKTVEVNIKEKEKLAVESRKRIVDIQKKATKEIEDIINEENLGKLHQEIEEEWDENL
jgi:hypothetical protein